MSEPNDWNKQTQNMKITGRNNGSCWFTLAECIINQFTNRMENHLFCPFWCKCSVCRGMEQYVWYPSMIQNWTILQFYNKGCPWNILPALSYIYIMCKLIKFLRIPLQMTWINDGTLSWQTSVRFQTQERCMCTGHSCQSAKLCIIWNVCVDKARGELSV